MTHTIIRFVATFLFAATFSLDFALAQEWGDTGAPNIEAKDTSVAVQSALPTENDTAKGDGDSTGLSDLQEQVVDTAVIETRSGSARITTEYFGMQRQGARRGLAVGVPSAPRRRLLVNDVVTHVVDDSATAQADTAKAASEATDGQPVDSADAAPQPSKTRTPVKIIATVTTTAAVAGLITLFVVKSRDKNDEGTKKIPDPPDPPGF